MLIDILLTSLSIFTSSQRTTVSPSRLHRRIRLVHAKRPPRQRLSPRRPTGSYPETLVLYRMRHYKSAGRFGMSCGARPIQLFEGSRLWGGIYAN